MAEENKCGGCSLCCKVTAIPELEKPLNKWCEHCAIGNGCTIYETRPVSCQQFRCLWLSGALSPEMRPDKSRVVFERLPSGKVYLVLVDPAQPDAWTRKSVQATINSLLMARRSLAINTNPATILTNSRSKASVIEEIAEVKKLYGV